MENKKIIIRRMEPFVFTHSELSESEKKEFESQLSVKILASKPEFAVQLPKSVHEKNDEEESQKAMKKHFEELGSKLAQILSIKVKQNLSVALNLIGLKQVYNILSR